MFQLRSILFILLLSLVYISSALLIPLGSLNLSRNDLSSTANAAAKRDLDLRDPKRAAAKRDLDLSERGPKRAAAKRDSDLLEREPKRASAKRDTDLSERDPKRAAAKRDIDLLERDPKRAAAKRDLSERDTKRAAGSALEKGTIAIWWDLRNQRASTRRTHKASQRSISMKGQSYHAVTPMPYDIHFFGMTMFLGIAKAVAASGGAIIAPTLEWVFRDWMVQVPSAKSQMAGLVLQHKVASVATRNTFPTLIVGPTIYTSQPKPTLNNPTDDPLVSER
ncbi:uncharacterized protein LACBIDRAFT_333765 [Laccaria bicolor S238N-H82]|uniref:Predicted protein n=1 Tax=Laccaria bicolor (strain S238N-H82 / ATCC MYA-4686) TaxID=486041 RepID=B0DX03_LACBS|nr:uncharacterized protein LACBIDRAFT_333765 [Laccaria bicolor S238N-H82]EDR00849.1 predicted protein [Laccaria bicolor S238N-H82]|eukprot:XP_001888443.1 predicted protein [Laccaria bicolor S238N-H82]